MAYREVGTMDIDQVIRRWLAGEKIRAIARLTGLDRNAIRRIVRSAEKVGVRRAAPWPDPASGKWETSRLCKRAARGRGKRQPKSRPIADTSTRGIGTAGASNERGVYSRLLILDAHPIQAHAVVRLPTLQDNHGCYDSAF